MAGEILDNFLLETQFKYSKTQLKIYGKTQFQTFKNHILNNDSLSNRTTFNISDDLLILFIQNSISITVKPLLLLET